MSIRHLLVLLLVLTSACSPQVPQVTPTPTSPAPAPTASALSPSATSPSPVSTASPAPSLTATKLGVTATKPGVTPSAGAAQPFPVRAAFYYPWFPQAWNQSGMNPFTHYHPALGFYNSSAADVIRTQITAMQYGKIQLGIASWWGQQHHTNTRVPLLLKAGEEMNFSWALYIESEGQGDPTPEAIRADLTYIRDRYASSPAYFKVNGRFLVFAYADAKDSCDMATRWKQANTVGAYVVLKVFDGFRSCPDQPDGWHQYAPANATESQDLYSYTISPGFYKATEDKPRLERDLTRWQSDIRSMIASKAKFQLITTFNEWGEGTAVEASQEWTSPSGYGPYLDALHNDGKEQ